MSTSASTEHDRKADLDGDLWTLEDVATYFKVSNRTVREWRNLDATFPLPLDLPGRSVRWYREDLTRWALSLRGERV